MTTDFRVVIDTNVIVSALLLPQPIPSQAFDPTVLAGRLLPSASTLAELNETLCRLALDRYVRGVHRLEFLAALVQDADIVEVQSTVTEYRDPQDNKFLELAVSGNATHLLTGDDDLLVLHPFRGIAISPHGRSLLWHPIRSDKPSRLSSVQMGHNRTH